MLLKTSETALFCNRNARQDMLWFVKSLKMLSGVDCAPTVKLWFLELVMAVDFAVSERGIFVLASCGMPR